MICYQKKPQLHITNTAQATAVNVTAVTNSQQKM